MREMGAMGAVGRDAGVTKYPVRMRILHWGMAVIILALIWAGWVMISPDEKTLS
jgi:cytochrome b561